VFDGGEAAFRDWNDIYNESFATHYHFVPTTVEHCRALAAGSQFLHDGLMLAYRDGRCVGFCRNEAVGDRGVIGLLGTAPAARGIGLGRALLRWGVCDIVDRGLASAGLMVDGNNESALALYRSEGFTVARTRHLWSRVLPAG
jgi:mycothiol synthase